MMSMNPNSNILIVEDDDALRAALCETAALAGYNALPAAHGNAALSVLADTDVDLVISDIQMKDQQISIEQTKNNLQTQLKNAYINYNNALKAIDLEKNNLVLAKENIMIATERYKRLNITSVELRQIQISYSDARNRLYNDLYQAKIAEATVALLSGDIANL